MTTGRILFCIGLAVAVGIGYASSYSSPQDSAHAAGVAVGSLGFLAAIVGGYLLPTIAAVCRKHHNTAAIFLINLCFGWLVIGWFVPLIWAVTETRRQRIMAERGYP